MGWKPGSRFCEGMSFISTSVCQDRRGCFHVVGVSAGQLYHVVRGSKSPFPSGGPVRVTEERVIGTPTIFLSSFANLEIACPLENGSIGHWWASPHEFPDPSAGPPPPPPPTAKRKIYVAAYDLMEARGDYLAFIDRVADAGGKAIRVFDCRAWNHPPVPAMYQIIGEFRHPDVPGVVFPKYRMRDAYGPLFNPAYLEKFERIAERMKVNDLEFSDVLHDRCSLWGDKTTKYFHPFICSEEALDENSPGGVWVTEGIIAECHKDLARNQIGILKRVGVKFSIEAFSEYAAKDWPDDYAWKFYLWWTAVIQSCGVTQDQLIHSAMQCDIQIFGMGGTWSHHGVVRPEDVPVINHKGPVILSGDGGFGGDGRADAKGRRGASVAQVEGICRKINERGYDAIEIIDRGLYAANNDQADLDAWDPEPTKAARRIFSER